MWIGGRAEPLLPSPVDVRKELRLCFISAAAAAEEEGDASETEASDSAPEMSSDDVSYSDDDVAENEDEDV